MPTGLHPWQPLLIYAAVAALLLMVLQRLPVIGRFVRLAFSAALLAFMIFLVLQIAPYQPELSRLTGRLGVDDQKVTGKELRVPMASDGRDELPVAATVMARRGPDAYSGAPSSAGNGK
jgi:aspartyl protease family protein